MAHYQIAIHGIGTTHDTGSEAALAEQDRINTMLQGIVHGLKVAGHHIVTASVTHGTAKDLLENLPEVPAPARETRAGG